LVSIEGAGVKTLANRQIGSAYHAPVRQVRQIPNPPNSGGRFFRLINEAGGALVWEPAYKGRRPDWQKCHAIPVNVTPESVEYGTPEEFLELSCAAHIVLDRSWIESVAPLRRISDACAVYRRIVGWFRPVYRKSSGIYDSGEMNLLGIMVSGTTREWTARDQCTARGLLRFFFSTDGIDLWETAPDWLRPSEATTFFKPPQLIV
jgi:hypothetical protein